MSTRRLPTRIMAVTVVPIAALIASATAAARDTTIARDAVLTAAILGFTYLALAIGTAGQVGMGDVRLATLSGLLLGPYGPSTVILAVVLPYLIAGPIIGAQAILGRIRAGSEVPFGPFLIIGAFAAVLIGTVDLTVFPA